MYKRVKSSKNWVWIIGAFISKKKATNSNDPVCFLFSTGFWRFLQIAGMDFVKQKCLILKVPLNELELKELSFEIISLFFLGIAECSKPSCAQRIMYLLTSLSVTDSIQLMTLEVIKSSASFVTEAYGWSHCSMEIYEVKKFL